MTWSWQLRQICTSLNVYHTSSPDFFQFRGTLILPFLFMTPFPFCSLLFHFFLRISVATWFRYAFLCHQRLFRICFFLCSVGIFSSMQGSPYPSRCLTMHCLWFTLFLFHLIHLAFWFIIMCFVLPCTCFVKYSFLRFMRGLLLISLHFIAECLQCSSTWARWFIGRLVRPSVDLCPLVRRKFSWDVYPRLYLSFGGCVCSSLKSVTQIPKTWISITQYF